MSDMEWIAFHYGEEVSAVLRNGDWPSAPSSWLLQRQDATAEAVSRWVTYAVYESREAADATVERWEDAKVTLALRDLETGDFIPADEQPLSVYRVVSLLDLFREGPEAIASAVYDLATSDHEWILSTELGSAAKTALIGGGLE